MTLKAAFFRSRIAEASDWPTTAGTRESGAATTSETLEPGSTFVPSATLCFSTVPFFLLERLAINLPDFEAGCAQHALDLGQSKALNCRHPREPARPLPWCRFGRRCCCCYWWLLQGVVVGVGLVAVGEARPGCVAVEIRAGPPAALVMVPISISPASPPLRWSAPCATRTRSPASWRIARTASLSVTVASSLELSTRSVVADHWPKSRRQLVAEGLNSSTRTAVAYARNATTARPRERQPGGWNAER